MKTKTNASFFFVLILAFTLAIAPHVKAAAIQFHNFIVPVIKAHLKAQAGTDITCKTSELLDVAQAKVLVLDSTILAARETAKAVVPVISEKIDTVKMLATSVQAKAKELYVREFTVNQVTVKAFIWKVYYHVALALCPVHLRAHLVAYK